MSRGRLADTDHRHGSNAGYAAGCGCEPCTVAHRDYSRATAAARLASRERVAAVVETSNALAVPDLSGVERGKAACAAPGVDKGWFCEPDVTGHDREPYRERLAHEAAARAVCGACTIRDECLSDALRDRDEWSIRGGLTARERRQLRSAAA